MRKTAFLNTSLDPLGSDLRAGLQLPADRFARDIRERRQDLHQGVQGQPNPQELSMLILEKADEIARISERPR